MSDVEEQESSVPALAVTAAVGAIVLLLVMLCGIGRSQEKSQSDGKDAEEENNIKKQKNLPKKKEKNVFNKKKENKAAFSHPWLAGSLKNHSSSVLGVDFSPNGKYLASCSEDRSIMLWNLKDFCKKEHKCVRANVELDHATNVRFSPDSKAMVVSLFNANSVRVIKFGRKDDGSVGNFQVAVDFPKGHDAEIINIGIASNGHFIMTCCRETFIKIWDLKGELLAVVDTHQMNNSYGALSPCGRFVACSGFTPGVKVWEVSFDKNGSFKEVVRAFELKGHTAGVYWFAFSNNSDRMATVSKDGTWKVWDTNVEYKKQQDARVLTTGQYNQGGPCIIALSPDSSTVAIAHKHIYIYNAYTAECMETIREPHGQPVTSLEFDAIGQFLVSAGDKNIYIFHNIVGYNAQISELEKKTTTAASNTHRERLEKQIQEIKLKLQSLETA